MESRRVGRLVLRAAVAAAFGLTLLGSAAPASAAAFSVPANAYSEGDVSGDAQTLGLIWT